MRYSAQLAFGYFVAGCSADTCEIRTVVFECASNDEAVLVANDLGSEKQYQFKNSDDESVLFQFLGTIEILKLDVCDDDEVWYSVSNMPCDELQAQCRDEFTF